jgi:hypothetical protein
VLDYPPGYDFHRSTFRFRRFGDDLASRWAADGLHRVLSSGLAVRIDSGGVTAFGDASAGDGAELRHLLGLVFDRDAFALAYPQIAGRAPGFFPPLMADPPSPPSRPR